MAITIEELLETARQLNASDVHIAVDISPKCRVNGRLCTMQEEVLQKQEVAELLKPMLTERQKSILDKYGETEFVYSTSQLRRHRVNIFKQKGFYAAVIRLISEEIPTLESLGMPEGVKELTSRRKGLVLVVGPQCSGKTTTLAALIGEINKKRDIHILTLEKPIEYLHTSEMAIITQRELGKDTLSYERGIKAAFHESADVISIAELNGLETIVAALTAAENGQLVFASLATTGTIEAIELMVSMFPQEQRQQAYERLAAALEAVIFQQLLPSEEGVQQEAAFEIMYNTASVKNLLREGKTQQLSATIENGRKSGMQSMDDAIYELYLRQKISRENALYYAQDYETLKRKL